MRMKLEIEKRQQVSAEDAYITKCADKPIKSESPQKKKKKKIRQIVDSLFIPSVWLKKMFPLATLKHPGSFFFFFANTEREKKSQKKTLINTNHLNT